MKEFLKYSPRYLLLVCFGVWLCSMFSCASPSTVCKNDGECTSEKPRCVEGVCRIESKEQSAEEPDVTVLSDGSEKVTEPVSDTNQTESPPEPADSAPELQPELADASPDQEQTEPQPEPADSTPELQPESADASPDQEQTESLPEPELQPESADASPDQEQTESLPEPADSAPELQPESSCNSGTSRPCYPVGKTGCTVDAVGKYECKGICALGTESCVNGSWSGQCNGAIEPTTEVCNGKDNDCDGQIDNGCGFSWATSAGGTGIDDGYSIAVDNAGNSYITGSYSGTASFGTITLTSRGYDDIFVAKVSSQGTFLWAISAGGTGIDSGRSIAVDGSGNIYITGEYQKTASFGTSTLTSQGSTDIFVAKVSSQGTFLWATSAGGTSTNDRGHGITVDGSGNIYITGVYAETASFGTTTLTSRGNNDIFVAKVSSQGTFLWATSAGGTGMDYSAGIGLDGSGNSYIAGHYYGTVSFGNTTLTSQGSTDIFIAKVSSQGAFLWATSVGGTNYDEGASIAVDSSGNSYITGFYYGIASFGSTTLTSKGSIFVAKVSSQGVFLWATSASAGGPGDDASTGITIDGSGNSYITGRYYGTVSFGTTTLTSQGDADIFIAKVSSQGAFLRATSAGGTGNDYGRSITVDGSGNIYINGYYSGTVSFGTTTITSKGNTDIFVAKFR